MWCRRKLSISDFVACHSNGGCCGCLYISMMPRWRRCPCNNPWMSILYQAHIGCHIQNLRTYPSILIWKTIWARIFGQDSLCVLHTRCVHICARVHTRVCAVLRAHVCWPCCRFTHSILDRMCKDSVCVRVGLWLCERCVCVARLKPFYFFVWRVHL